MERIRKSYALLRALRTNVPDGARVGLQYVEQYQQALQHLEASGYDVADFRIAEDAIYRPRGLADMLFSTRASVERGMLMARLDAVLCYFTLPADKIGFQGPRK